MKKVGLGWGGEPHRIMNNKLTQVSSISLREQQNVDIRKVPYYLVCSPSRMPMEVSFMPHPAKTGGVPPRAVKISNFP